MFVFCERRCWYDILLCAFRKKIHTIKECKWTQKATEVNKFLSGHPLCQVVKRNQCFGNHLNPDHHLTWPMAQVDFIDFPIIFNNTLYFGLWGVQIIMWETFVKTVNWAGLWGRYHGTLQWYSEHRMGKTCSMHEKDD
jgi:hypothetical protein